MNTPSEAPNQDQFQGGSAPAGAPKWDTQFRYDIIAATIMTLALLGVLGLGLLAPLLAGLLIYQLIKSAASVSSRIGIHETFAKTIVLVLIAAIIMAGIVLLVIGFVSQLSGGPDSLAALLRTLAEIVDGLRSRVPDWAKPYFQTNVEELSRMASRWLRDNALQIGILGRTLGTALVQTLIGMIIGGLMVFAPASRRHKGPLAAALSHQVAGVSDSFRRVVFSQIRISALNTALTGIFLGFLLPQIGFPLPFTKTLIFVTFVAGLLPVIGNIISNTIITLVGVSVSPWAAGLALGYLILIHKLEYFLNAKIIGNRIGARAWEMLTAMLVMEAAFGLGGVVAAPIYYAYTKSELKKRGLL